MKKRKYLFIDRDGTLISEPEDNQIDTFEKFFLIPDVIPSLLRLKNAGFNFVMVSNQDGLGTPAYPEAKYRYIQKFLLDVLSSQGIEFEAVRICPHFESQLCDCRKPKVGLVLDYLTDQKIDRENSYVIGDRKTDLDLANNMGIQGIHFGIEPTVSWPEIASFILGKPREVAIVRKTQETDIKLVVNLDDETNIHIQTGIGFFDHMLEQLAKHGGFSLKLEVTGDLQVDEHHTVEDTALALGEALKKALGDKRGISRYGFTLPMDESFSQVRLDLSGRSYFVFKGKLARESIGGLPTELIPHFFRSFAESLKSTLHIQVKGENTHHMIEAIFKAVGRALRQAIKRESTGIPSTKGVL
jgi:imidazoleglycerol-phosphate dehydratase/histidinol-phosphatase